MKIRFVMLFAIIVFLNGIHQVNAEKGDLLRGLNLSKSIFFANIIPDSSLILLLGKEEFHFGPQYFNSTESMRYPISYNRSEYKFLCVSMSTATRNQQYALGCSDGSILVGKIADLSKENAIKEAYVLPLTNKDDVISAITAITFSPDQQTLASGTKSGKIIVCDTQTRKILFEDSIGNRSKVNTVAFSPDGQYLASGTADGSIKLWDIRNNKKFPLLHTHNGSVNAVVFSPNSQILASGADDKLIKLWNIPDMSTHEVFEGHTGAVKTIAFSPDENHLASGGLFGEILLWHLPTKEKIEPITRYKEISGVKFSAEHQQDLLSVTFTENGQKLFSISEDYMAEWYLSKININPDRDELYVFRKPTPLIEVLQQQDKKGPEIAISDDVKVNVPWNEENTTVSGDVSDLSKIKLVTVKGNSVNDLENGKFAVSVPLQEGNNQITVVATDVNNNSSEETITIYREPSPDTVKPSITIVSPSLNQDNYADITLDIENYYVSGKVTDDKSGIDSINYSLDIFGLVIDYE